MDSEESAHLTVLQRNKRQLTFANKKRVINVIQCSGEDMSLVLASGGPPPTTVSTIPAPTVIPQLPIMPRQFVAPRKSLYVIYLMATISCLLKVNYDRDNAGLFQLLYLDTTQWLFLLWQIMLSNKNMEVSNRFRPGFQHI